RRPASPEKEGGGRPIKCAVAPLNQGRGRLLASEINKSINTGSSHHNIPEVLPAISSLSERDLCLGIKCPICDQWVNVCIPCEIIEHCVTAAVQVQFENCAASDSRAGIERRIVTAIRSATATPVCRRINTAPNRGSVNHAAI